MFAAFIILPTRFWPRNDRELPFLAIALFFCSPRSNGSGIQKRDEREERGGVSSRFLSDKSSTRTGY